MAIVGLSARLSTPQAALAIQPFGLCRFSPLRASPALAVAPLSPAAGSCWRDQNRQQRSPSEFSTGF